MGKICFEKREVSNYPDRSTYYNPSICYPEYMWGERELSDDKNAVYDMMRSCFFRLGMDSANYGSPCWNPLGDIIKKGDTVLLKPNLVYHVNNATEGDMDCMITHPSILRCAIDYCLIALGVTGKLILGDAPIQSCDFDKLIIEGGYKEVIDFYRRQKVELKIEDFRATVSVKDNGIIINTKREDDENGKYTLVNLGDKSFFCTVPASKTEYRIADYYHKELTVHHYGETHEYLIHNAALEADVIINLPKPKMHRKAGLTGAMKNFIGVCSKKEYLPHHVKGSKLSGGDEYNGTNPFKWSLSQLSDRLNHYQLNDATIKAKLIYTLMRAFSLANRLFYKDLISDGGWYGNDTLWRTVLDINLVLMYCDARGVFDIEKGEARKIFTIGDMILAGEREGPLTPSPKELGIIAMSDDVVTFDEFFFQFTGFQFTKVPLIKYASTSRWLQPRDNNESILCSNIDKFNGMPLNHLNVPDTWKLEPSEGWKEARS